jgi:hypothetical protein
VNDSRLYGRTPGSVRRLAASIATSSATGGTGYVWRTSTGQMRLESVHGTEIRADTTVQSEPGLVGGVGLTKLGVGWGEVALGCGIVGLGAGVVAVADVDDALGVPPAPQPVMASPMEISESAITEIERRGRMTASLDGLTGPCGPSATVPPLLTGRSGPKDLAKRAVRPAGAARPRPPRSSSEIDRPGRMGGEPYDRRSSNAALTPDRACRDRITAK